MQTPDPVIDSARLSLRDGIWLDPRLQSETVWDAMARDCPIHAVISASDEEAAREKSAPQIERLKSHVTPETVLLDVGCGYGRVAKYLLTRRQIGRYVGIDSSAEMLRLFRDRHAASDLERRTPATLVCSDIVDLPLHDGSVDLVFVSAVFLHNHKSITRAAMAEIARVLRPGGILLVFSSFPRRATAMGLQGALHQAYLNLHRNPRANGPVRYFSRGEILSMTSRFRDVQVIASGFEVVPKSLIGLPGFAQAIYRRVFSSPLNSVAEKLLPRAWHRAFARHYDVVARK